MLVRPMHGTDRKAVDLPEKQARKLIAARLYVAADMSAGDDPPALVPRATRKRRYKRRDMKAED